MTYFPGLLKKEQEALEAAFDWNKDIYSEQKEDESIPAQELSLLECLPPQYPYDRHFAERFMKAMTDAAYKIKHEGGECLSCVAEEFAFYTLLETAKTFLEEKGETDFERLDLFAENIFEDNDFLRLFNKDIDGFDNDESLALKMGYAHLQFQNWFTPFRSANVP